MAHFRCLFVRNATHAHPAMAIATRLIFRAFDEAARAASRRLMTISTRSEAATTLATAPQSKMLNTKLTAAA